ncbi:MAG: radical SAM protein [Lachnospiraceae bacterium]|nr:radical SAM protein [Lachnospiraceae bacterium]
MAEFDIQAYMTAGVERVVKDALKATFKNPRESAYMMKFAAASKEASKKRAKSEAEGLHIPPFLIASITSKCNLHCAGCYSRSNHATEDCEAHNQLTGEEWSKIFDEADELGVSFILLAGGEPLIRRDVIESAAKRSNILFPIFTNGVYINDSYFDLFDKHRNLVPIMSIEGGRESTDARRGEGIYDKLIQNMDRFHEENLIFGCSVTVTTQNINDVVSEEFISSLANRGCKAVIFVEYVPVTEESKDLAIGEKEREFFDEALKRLRREHEEMVFVSFPGDEKSSGGCIAAGRGFFHINSHGGAEPCPFSPYSDINVRETSLKDAIHSKLFRTLVDGGLLNDDHKGGCVLFEKREQVIELQKKSFE